MAKFSFLLKDPKSETPTLIYFAVRHGSNRLKYSTGEKINPGQWDKSMYSVKKGVKGAKGINDQLSRYTSVFRKYTMLVESEDLEFSLIELRTRLDQHFKVVNEKPKTTFSDFINDYINRSSKAHNTKRNYRNTLNQIIAFEDHRKKKLQFNEIDLTFYDNFRNFLLNKGYTKNTRGSFMKNIKVFMEAAHAEELHKNFAYKHKNFKVETEDVEDIYLTDEEINTLYRLEDLSPRLDKARDIFVLNCRTGVRYGDLKKITKESIISMNGRKFFEIKTEKTQSTVYIPIHGQAMAILKKYNFVLPRIPSNVKLNEYIKEVAKQAKFESQVQKTRDKGGKLKTDVLLKWQLVTVHTARRSFATNAFKAGIPAQTIMKITGHRTERAFQRYIKLTNKEHAEIMAEHSFFSPLSVAK